MLDGLDDVAGSGLSLGANHGRAFRDAAQSFAQIPGPAHKGGLERVLIDMVFVVGGREHFALVDEVDAQGFEDLCFGEVPDAHFGHDGNRDGFLNADDHLRIRHAGYASGCPNVGRHPLERHHRHRPGVFCDLCLLGRRDVHDDAALEVFGQTTLNFPAAQLLLAHLTCLPWDHP